MPSSKQYKMGTIMKFLISFIMTGIILITYNDANVYAYRDNHQLIPSKIISGKKIEPLRSPISQCVLGPSSVVIIRTLDEYIEVCVNQRLWYKISD
jgi:hypothetical protein